MSNHSGSYMLNDVLRHLLDADFINLMGKRRAQSFTREIVKLAEKEYDCNSGEILEGIVDELELCISCMKATKRLKDELCAKCHAEWYDEEESGN